MTETLLVMMNPNNPQTPGVYTVEKNAFPPSVAQVPTAIPAFVGYTEKAEYQGKSLIKKPTLINSLTEFSNYFGGAPEYKFPINLVTNTEDPTKPPTPDEYDFTIKPHYYKIGPAQTNTLFYMYNCLRLFYLNGGGPAYIVSVGTFKKATINVTGTGANQKTTEELEDQPVSRDALLEGLNLLPLIQFPKPTMILIPDALALDKNDCYMVQQQIIAQAGALKDRVALLDIYDGFKDYTKPGDNVIADFRNNMGVSNLNYAIAYYPWLQTEVVTAAEITYVNIAPRAKDATATDPTQDISKLIVGVPLLNVLSTVSTDYETLEADVLVPPPPTGNAVQYASWNAAFNGESTGSDADNLNQQATAIAQMFGIIHDLGNGGKSPSSGTANITITSKDLINSIGLMSHTSGPLGLQMVTAYQYLNKFPGIGTAKGLTQGAMTGWGWKSSDLPTSDPYKYPDGVTQAADKQAIAFPIVSQVLKSAFDVMLESLHAVIADAKTLVNQYNSSLETSNKTYKTIMTAMAHQANKLPPASAMAGIYTTVDNTLGVWHAPANRNIDAVIEPLVSINDDSQAPLNVDALSGKSINAIRSFYGRGPAMVWGARTMDGNSLDWRYINVRRLMIMLEQSVANAAFSLVFEPNDSSTWSMCESMISNFLHNLWSEGALQGSSPADAYSVSVGLGKTMMPIDILNGIMRVQVKVAVVRPAEFIIITYEQEMPKS